MKLEKKLVQQRSKKAHVPSKAAQRLVPAEVQEKTKARTKPGGFAGKKWYPESGNK